MNGATPPNVVGKLKPELRTFWPGFIAGIAFVYACNHFDIAWRLSCDSGIEIDERGLTAPRSLRIFGREIQFRSRPSQRLPTAPPSSMNRRVVQFICGLAVIIALFYSWLWTLSFINRVNIYR